MTPPGIPCSRPPQGITSTPSPPIPLSDTSEVYPVGTCTGEAGWRVGVIHRTLTRLYRACRGMRATARLPMEQHTPVPQPCDQWQQVTQGLQQQWWPSEPVLTWVPEWGPLQFQQVLQQSHGQQPPPWSVPLPPAPQYAAPQFFPDHVTPPCQQPPVATADAPTPQAASAPPTASSPPDAAGPTTGPAAAEPPHLQSTPRADDEQALTFNCDEPAERDLCGAEMDRMLSRKNANAIMKDLGQCLSRCSLARCNPQPPWFASLLVCEVSPGPLVVRWRCILRKRHQSACGSARYNPHPPAYREGKLDNIERPHPIHYGFRRIAGRSEAEFRRRHG